MDATLFFWMLAAVAVTASLLVIGQRNPMYSVLLLIVSFGALSGLYVLLDAPFVAAIQIIIYAGAIMVLFLFVVMLLNVPTEDAATGDRARLLGGAGPRRFGAVLSALLVVELVWALSSLRRRRCRGRVGGRDADGLRHRRAALPRVRVRVRSDVGADSRRDGRRDRAREKGASCVTCRNRH